MCALAAFAVVAGGLLQAPVVFAGPGTGDQVDWYWQVGGQVLCLNVTNGGPKGKGIWDLHVHRSSGSMIVAGVFSSPVGWTGTATPPDDAKWVATGGSPIKMKGTVTDFCLSVGAGGSMKLDWETTDRAGRTINTGTLNILYP